MKLNLDLLREIVILIEAENEWQIENPWKIVSVTGYSNKEIQYHLRMLTERGFLHKESIIELTGDMSGAPVSKYLPDALTFSGHEFLESVRDPEVWKKAKEGAKHVGGFSLSLVGALAKGFVKKKAEQHAGIELDI